MKILLLVLLISINSFGHGDHSAPGRIPPAPHGGSLGEAEHHHSGSGKHDHKKAQKKQIFFEGILKNNKLTLYILELDPIADKFFVTHDFNNLKDYKLTIKDARKDKMLDKEPKIEEKKLVVDMTGERARRLILNIEGKYEEAKYSAKIQVERK